VALLGGHLVPGFGEDGGEDALFDVGDGFGGLGFHAYALGDFFEDGAVGEAASVAEELGGEGVGAEFLDLGGDVVGVGGVVGEILAKGGGAGELGGEASFLKDVVDERGELVGGGGAEEGDEVGVILY